MTSHRSDRFRDAGNVTKTCRCGRVVKASNLARHQATQACRDGIAARRAETDEEMFTAGLEPTWPGSP